MDIKSLISIWNHTQQHPGTSGARACAGVLLGLYNGSRFPFDLTELRLLDKPLREAALAVITCDATRCEREVHEWLRTAAAGLSFGARLEWLATDYKCFKRGACTVKSLREEYGERPRSLVIQVPSNTLTGKNAASVIVDDPYVEQTGTSQAREFKVGPTLNLSYDQITQHGLQLTPEQTAAVKAAISAPSQGAEGAAPQAATMCPCGDRPAAQCDEQWGPKCDLGNNAKHAKVYAPAPTAPQEADALREALIELLQRAENFYACDVKFSSFAVARDAMDAARAALAQHQPQQGFTYRGFKIVENEAVPPGELWVQQSGRNDIDAHHRAMSTPFFNDLAG